MNSRLTGLLAAAACFGLLAGVFAGSPASVEAQACNLNTHNCNPSDDTVTASAIVSHAYPDEPPLVIPVEPDTGETWEITATYQLQTGGSACDCDDRTDTVTVDVDWNETTDSWDVSCTGCNAGDPIQAVSVCHSAGCGSHTTIDNAWEYEIIVDVHNNYTFSCGIYNHDGALQSVDFETTSVDDGDTIRTGNCTEQLAVSPTSQTFSSTDSGPFECLFTCAAATGTSIVILYE